MANDDAWSLSLTGIITYEELDEYGRATGRELYIIDGHELPQTDRGFSWRITGDQMSLADIANATGGTEVANKLHDVGFVVVKRGKAT